MSAWLSKRTEAPKEENRLTKLLRQVSARRPVIDLTASNPTTAAIDYPAAEIRRAISREEILAYRPSARGHIEARKAISAFYKEETGALVDADRIVIVASTSEAYSVLFKILCDPGDVVLAPRPSYPLLEHLATFESVRLAPYALAYDGAWHVDTESLWPSVNADARAILSVSPNNPTGSYLKRSEMAAMRATGLPVISDEVFAQYPLCEDPSRVVSVCTATKGLTFALSGLSKLVGLPQMKLAWIVVSGEEKLVDVALRRIDHVCDTLLSVGTPVQVALPEILQAARGTRDAIRARTRRNLVALQEKTADHPVTLLDVEGGWYAILRLPFTRTEEAWAEGLLREHAIYTHPGHFFDMATEPFLVVSLLTPPGAFDEGTERLLSYVKDGC